MVALPSGQRISVIEQQATTPRTRSGASAASASAYAPPVEVPNCGERPDAQVIGDSERLGHPAGDRAAPVLLLDGAERVAVRLYAGPSAKRRLPSATCLSSAARISRAKMRASTPPRQNIPLRAGCQRGHAPQENVQNGGSVRVLPDLTCHSA